MFRFCPPLKVRQLLSGIWTALRMMLIQEVSNYCGLPYSMEVMHTLAWRHLCPVWSIYLRLGNSCSNETLEAFVRLLSNSSGERFRMRVLEDCIRNLQTGDNVATTCTIIKRIICLYPSSASWLNSVVGASSSRRSVIELLEVKICVSF